MQPKIPNYQIVKLIGAGGMGEVYEAVHEQIQSRAAIKVLRAMFAQNKEVAQRFINEARAVNIISHPSLVNIYELGQTDDGSPYIVMELLSGETLRQRLNRVGKLPPTQAMDFARQIASALAVAHSKQIVHRDLKPVNLIIVDDADMASGERVKVVDFGIAKIISAVGDEALTRTGTSLGTPRYMSPEQCKNARSVTDRTDVYTLGLILYEMLCGDSPYAEIKSEVRLMEAHLMKPAPPLSARGTPASAELCTLVHRMLEKQPAARPSAAEAARILRQLKGDLNSAALPVLGEPPLEPLEPVSTSGPASAVIDRPSAHVKNPAPRALRERLPIIVAAVALLLGLVGLFVVLRFALRPPAARGHGAAAAVRDGGLSREPADQGVHLDASTPSGPAALDANQPTAEPKRGAKKKRGATKSKK